MKRLLYLVAVVGCGSDPATDLTVSASFTIASASGAGTSPLDGLVGQAVTFEVVLTAASTGHEDAAGCKRTTTGSSAPEKTASGATAATVQTGILDHLPDWDAKLELCDTAALSSVSLLSDNQAGLAVTLGCRDLPASALAHDGDGNAAWTAFSATTCDGSVYDQLNGRLFTASAITLRIAP